MLNAIDIFQDTLFPFVLNKAESFLNDKWEDSEVKEVVLKLRETDSEIPKVCFIYFQMILIQTLQLLLKLVGR